MSETILAAPDIQVPPTQLELPYDDGVSMESARHKAQMDLLIDALIPWWERRVLRITNVLACLINWTYLTIGIQ